MAKNSIALIGFMATGKTTVGKALVDYLGRDYTFIETDQIIIEDVGRSIPEIFAEEGEDKFREYEIFACKKASGLNKIVVSCGGGVVLNNKNIENLKKNCFIVLLQATVEEIYERALQDDLESRPLLNKLNPKVEIKKILNFRKPFYEKSADIIVDTTQKDFISITQEILKKLNFI